MTRRAEVLRATEAAARVVAEFPVGKRASFDVVSAVTQLGVPLLYRPLQGLWGASVSIDGNGPSGILVTTKLGMHVQRFTLAHELGHVILGHKTSLDVNDSIGLAGRYGPMSRPTEEIAADTFASELLAPRALLLDAARRHNWTNDRLSEGQWVYQLSLRLGISYKAACWGLANAGAVSESTARRLQGEPVKRHKRRFAPERLISDPWSGVWHLTVADNGLLFEADSEDLFAVALLDNASAGYLWELVEGDSSGRIVGEAGDNLGDEFGRPHTRIVYLRFDAPGLHRLVFEHKRRWNDQKLAHIDIAVDNYGKELGGLARQVRSAALAGGGGTQ